MENIEKYLEKFLSEVEKYEKKNEEERKKIREICKGQFRVISRKVSPLTSRISHFITIFDSPSSSKPGSLCIVLSPEYARSLVFSLPASKLSVFGSPDVSRVFLVEPAPGNDADVNGLMETVCAEVYMMLSDEKGGVMFRGIESCLRREVVEEGEEWEVREEEGKEKDFRIRQLMYNRNGIYPIAQVKNILTSKKNPNNYIKISTLEKYEKKGIIQCLDPSFVFSVYDRSLISTVFYLDLQKYPSKKVRLLELGPNVGFVTFQMNKFFRGNVDIEAVEKKKEFKEIGEKHFGLSFRGDKNISWKSKNPVAYVENMVEKEKEKEKYDLIFNEVVEEDEKEEASPNKYYFTEKFLSSAAALLKDNGIYTVSVIAKSPEALYSCFSSLKKHFKSIYILRSNGRLISLYFCIKGKVDHEEYTELFKKNIKLFQNEEIFDFSVLKTFYSKILGNIRDEEEEIKYFKKYIGNSVEIK